MSNQARLTKSQARNLARLAEADGVVEYDRYNGFRSNGRPFKGLHSGALTALIKLGLVGCKGRYEERTRKQRKEEIRGGYIVKLGWETYTQSVWVCEYFLNK